MSGRSAQSCALTVVGAAPACAPTFQLVKDGLPQPASCSFALCGCVDLVIDPLTSDLSTAHQLESHVWMTMAVMAAPSEADAVPAPCVTMPACGGTQGGWWWDSFRQHKIGSRLWTLEGQPPNTDTRLRAEQMVVEDLAYLVDAAVVDRVEVSSQIDPCTGLLCISRVDLVPPQGAAKSLAIDCLWPRGTP